MSRTAHEKTINYLAYTWQNTDRHTSITCTSNVLDCTVHVTNARVLQWTAQWRKSVVKEEGGGQGQSGQTIKLFQASRKISFTFYFDTSLSSLMMWNLRHYPTTVLNERMWHDILGGQNILCPWRMVSGSRPQLPGIFDPAHASSSANIHGIRSWQDLVNTYVDKRQDNRQAVLPWQPVASVAAAVAAE